MGIHKKLFLKKGTFLKNILIFKKNQKKNWTVPKSLFFITYIFFQIRQFYTEWHKRKLKLPIVTRKLDSSLNEKNRTKTKTLQKASTLHSHFVNWQLLALLQSSIVCCFLCNPYRELTPSSPADLVRNNLQCSWLQLVMLVMRLQEGLIRNIMTLTL